jgi:hypothetical protein
VPFAAVLALVLRSCVGIRVAQLRDARERRETKSVIVPRPKSLLNNHLKAGSVVVAGFVHQVDECIRERHSA